jgi:catechol-2,3-dioxygenase
MKEWYENFLGAKCNFANPISAFLTFDEEHHRFALVQLPGQVDKVRDSCGLEHIAFTYTGLTDLTLAYLQRKELGIHPIWSVNHGATTSIYYRDPDGNNLETQVDNFDTAEATNEFITSDEFRINPVGVDFDPVELIERIQAGEDEKVLKRRAGIGPRGP